jgi:hypothetical protein
MIDLSLASQPASDRTASMIDLSLTSHLQGLPMAERELALAGGLRDGGLRDGGLRDRSLIL